MERHQGESHVGAEENKEADGGEVGGPIGNGGLADYGSEGELGENNGNEEGEDVYGEDGFFGSSGVGVED